MRTEQLHYFREAARHGSINAAAEKLHMSQQGLNASLKMLEKDLGYELFTTSRYGITLTPQGEIVLAYADKMLAGFHSMQNALSSSMQNDNLTEEISIQTAPVVSEFIFPIIFKALNTAYPQLSLVLTDSMPLKIIKNVTEGHCDLGILGLQYTLLNQLGIFAQLSSELEFVPLYQYKLAVIADDQHPLAKYKSISVRTLLKYPLAILSRTNYEEDLNYKWLTLMGTPDIKLVTSSSAIYYDAIRSGSAVGFYPNPRQRQFDISPEPGTTVISLKDENAIHTVGYLRNSTKPITPAMQAIINELHRFCD